MAAQPIYVHPHRVPGGQLRLVVLLDDALFGVARLNDQTAVWAAWTAPAPMLGLTPVQLTNVLRNPQAQTPLIVASPPSLAEVLTANVLYAPCSEWSTPAGLVGPGLLDGLLVRWGLTAAQRNALLAAGQSWRLLTQEPRVLRWTTPTGDLSVRFVYRARLGNVANGALRAAVPRCRGSPFFAPMPQGTLQPMRQRWVTCVAQGQLEAVSDSTLQWMLAHRVGPPDPDLFARADMETVVLDVRAHWLFQTTQEAIDNATASSGGLARAVSQLGLEPREQLRLLTGATTSDGQMATVATATQLVPEVSRSDQGWLQWWAVVGAPTRPAAMRVLSEQAMTAAAATLAPPNNTHNDLLRLLLDTANLDDLYIAAIDAVMPPPGIRGDDEYLTVLRSVVAVVLASRGVSTQSSAWGSDVSVADLTRTLVEYVN